MSHDPREGMSESARALLQRAVAPRPRTPAERARTTHRVTRLAATPVVAGGVWLSWKGALLAAALVAGGVGVVVTRHLAEAPAPDRTSARPAPRPIAPAATAARVPDQVIGPVTLTPTVTVAVAAVAPRGVRPGVVRAAPVAARTVATPVVEAPVEEPAAPIVGGGGGGAIARPAEDELHVLERARSLLGTDPAEALRMVQAEGSPTSAGLAEERELITLDALRRLGRTDALRARGEGFLQRFPRSLYAERVRRWLAP